MTVKSTSWLAQLGVLVVHNDPVVEAELWRMAPPGVTVHTARFDSPTRGGQEYTGESWQRLIGQPDVVHGLTQLGEMDLTAICLCFGSASFLGGPGFDDGFTAAAARYTAGTPVYTAGQAMTAALAALRVHRPLIVAPPWFTAPTFAATKAYLDAAGISAAGLVHYRLGGRWGGVPGHQLFDRGGRWQVDPDEVCRQVTEGFPGSPGGADSVLIPGSGFRSWEAVGRLEQHLGVPVVTSNQACLWHLLDTARLDLTGLHTAGRLFALTRKGA